jgi:hypothetical protein
MMDMNAPRGKEEMRYRWNSTCPLLKGARLDLKINLKVLGLA